MPVSSAGAYQLSGTAFSGNGSGGQYNSANRQYFGYACYDVDHNQISALDTAKVPGSTDTVLAQALNPGDTKIYLQNATGWYAGSVSYERSVAWYGYTNHEGYTYPNYTYTQHVVSNEWAAGGISGNVITLSQPWSGPALAAGAAVRNATSGGSFDYAPSLTYAAVPNNSTTYTMTVSGTQQNGVDIPTQFRPGTAYVEPVMLVNYQGTTDNLVTWQNVTWTPVATQVGDVMNAQVTVTGGTGAKTLAGSSGSFPSGLSLNGASGMLTGTVAAAGTYNFTITATDSVGGTGSQACTMTILPATSMTVTTSSPNPSAYGQPVTFTATITAGSGTFDNGGAVQFAVDGNNIGGPVPLTGGVATIQDATLDVGPHAVIATYSGDANFNASAVRSREARW